MSAESSLTAVAAVRALFNEDTEGLAVLLPDGWLCRRSYWRQGRSPTCNSQTTKM